MSIMKLNHETAGAVTVARAFSQRFAADESGTTAIEYALIAALVSVACIAALKQLGGTNSGGWGDVANKITAAMQ